MARQPRFVLPGHPQHVIQRGNNRDIIFVTDTDREFYLEVLLESCRRFECRIHAYVLMTNHVHFLLTPDTQSAISQVMQSVGRRYVQYFNYSYRRTGTLWEGRYKSTLIDTEKYLLTCHRYIELNPVRARMVDAPSEYCWSSHRHNALGQYDPVVTPHELYEALGSTDSYRQRAYFELFKNAVEEQDLRAIRESTNKAWVLGDDRFKEKIQAALDRQAMPKVRGGDRKSKDYLASRINRV